MLLSMLKAVSKMLESPSPEKTGCAKAIVDELIEFYTDNSAPKPPSTTSVSSLPDSPSEGLDSEAAAAQEEILSGD